MGVMDLLQEIAALALKKAIFSILTRNDGSTWTLICEKSFTIIYPTHPPRLSGFDREAQPWRVFFACHKSAVA